MDINSLLPLMRGGGSTVAGTYTWKDLKSRHPEGLQDNEEVNRIGKNSISERLLTFCCLQEARADTESHSIWFLRPRQLG